MNLRLLVILQGDVRNVKVSVLKAGDGAGVAGGPGSHFGACVRIGRLLRAHQLLPVFTWLLPVPSGAVRVVAGGGR